MDFGTVNPISAKKKNRNNRNNRTEPELKQQLGWNVYWIRLEYVIMGMQGDALMVKVNKLTSTKTQLPYSYYSLPYCRPEKIVDSAENLGEVLRGDRIENSPFVVSFFSFFTYWLFLYVGLDEIFLCLCCSSKWGNLRCVLRFVVWSSIRKAPRP